MQSASSGKSVRKSIGLTAGIIGGIVGGIFGSQAGREAVQHVFRSDASIDRELVEAANQINATLPRTIDRNTRLDSTAALPGKKFCYLYTILDLDPPPTAGELEAMMKPLMINNYRTAPEMKTMRDQDVTLVYKYRDEAGNLLASFEVTTRELE
ncbi:MAG: hypothetical protein KF847_14640 [Pirellulales bacterium]|nr:hypothetical protein [Pirellulales bacterium]